MIKYNKSIGKWYTCSNNYKGIVGSIFEYKLIPDFITMPGTLLFIRSTPHVQLIETITASPPQTFPIIKILSTIYRHHFGKAQSNSLHNRIFESC